jgi:hypothetical protein
MRPKLSGAKLTGAIPQALAKQRRIGAIAQSLRALVKQRREALGSGSWCMPASPDDHIAAASDHSVTAVGVRGELVLTVSSALGTTIPVH